MKDFYLIEYFYIVVLVLRMFSTTAWDLWRYSGTLPDPIRLCEFIGTKRTCEDLLSSGPGLLWKYLWAGKLEMFKF